MPRSFFRAVIIGLAVVLLAACTTVRFGYSQGPELAFWWLDRYLDFDDVQETRAREAIAEWFRWHRATQLPDYAALVARLEQDAAGAVTPAQVCQWVDLGQARMDVSFQHALPAVADAVRNLSPQQLQHLERKYAKNLKEARKEFLQSDIEERKQAQLKRVLDKVETLYGSASPAQRERIAQLNSQSPFDPQAWIEERERRQQDALQSLRRLNAEHAGPEEARAVVTRLYTDMFRSPREAYRQQQKRYTEYNCAFVSQVHNLATPEQRTRAVKRLKGWEEDFRALAATQGG